MYKIGQSTDIHPLACNRPLILGGVEIPHPLGCVGHSDADVLVHAIAESILGALNLGDLGKHFPDTDPQYQGISSMILLKQVYQLMSDRKYAIANIDSTILIEKPKLAPYIDRMKENIAEALNCTAEQVSVKATRGEELGFIGKEEGVMVNAVCLLKKEK